MKGSLCLMGLLLVAAIEGLGQVQFPGVRYMTVPTIRSPAPGLLSPPFFPFVPEPQAPASTAPAASATPPPPARLVSVQRRLAFPKVADAETENRVLQFQIRRAHQGSPYAQMAMGKRYLEGDGVKRDLAQARKWLEKAARSGNSEAREWLLKLESKNPQTPGTDSAKKIEARGVVIKSKAQPRSEADSALDSRSETDMK